jgi:dTDP-4-dehydrorhamnose reductase
MRVLITGAGGGVGGALAAALRHAHTVLACRHDDLDITDAAAIRHCVADFGPDAIVNPAAITDVDACERDPARAERVNALAPGYLAGAAEAAGALFVQISTDYVFDGHKGTPYVETDPVCPLSQYGRTKAAGEAAALAGCSRAYVARTAWVMNPAKPGFIAAMLAAAARGTARVSRQTGSPTGLSDLVRALTALLLTPPAPGVYHLVNAGCCTRRAMAEEIFRLLEATVALEEVDATDFGPAIRPIFSALASPAWTRAEMPCFRPWQEALAETVATVRQRMDASR